MGSCNELAVYPDEPKPWQLIDRYPDTEAKNRVYKIIEALSKADFTQYGAAVGDGDKFPSLRFANDAQALFYEWLAELQEKLQGDDEPVILEHLGKYRSLMPSLALNFHLIEIADGTAPPGPVSMRAAKLAAAWCDYLESHARRIYGLVTNASKQAAATLAGKIRKGKLNDGFTVRDVYRQNWHLLTDRQAAQNACDGLVFANAQAFVEAVNRHGGDAEILHLPMIGIFGNTHFPMSDLNNVEIANLLSQYLRQKGLYSR